MRVVTVDGESLNKILPTKQAVEMAKERGLDLVEIASKADPPVCKIMEYSKFLYEQKKKEKEAKAKQHKTVMKEVRFGPNTSEHDFDFKTKHAYNFLKEGNKVKAYIRFFGRNIVHKDRGRDLLEKFIEELEEVGKVETPIKMEGKRMYLIMTPLGSKN